MSEEHQARALAAWLDGAPGAEPPDDLDPDVIEAVVALRPEHAPPPRVSADDVLSGIAAGPFGVSPDGPPPLDGQEDADPMTPDAARLAGWLDGHDTPDDLDPDVVEAIAALRPDLAPPPRVTADDVLAGIEAGPFAAGADVVPFPAPREEPSRWRRWAGAGGVSALLLAAAVLLTVRLEPPAYEASRPPAPGSSARLDAPVVEEVAEDEVAEEAMPEAAGRKVQEAKVARDDAGAVEPTAAPSGEEQGGEGLFGAGAGGAQRFGSADRADADAPLGGLSGESVATRQGAAPRAVDDRLATGVGAVAPPHTQAQAAPARPVPPPAPAKREAEGPVPAPRPAAPPSPDALPETEDLSDVPTGAADRVVVSEPSLRAQAEVREEAVAQPAPSAEVASRPREATAYEPTVDEAAEAFGLDDAAQRPVAGNALDSELADDADADVVVRQAPAVDATEALPRRKTRRARPAAPAAEPASVSDDLRARALSGLRPVSSDAVDRVRALLAAGRHADAEREAAAALETATGDERAWLSVLRGDALMALGREGEGRRAYEQALGVR